jgi:hypothetical protein
MKAASLRDEIIAGCVELAWNQWSQLGLSGFAPERPEQRAADPEALLLFSFEIARHDARLFDEVLDWLLLNRQLVSVQRLRNLCDGSLDTALVDAALNWSDRGRKSSSENETVEAADLVPLFGSAPWPGSPVDPIYASHGFGRGLLKASGKSQPPRLRDPINFAFRLRRLLGVGVRAEVVRLLLTIRAPRVSGRVLSVSAAYAQRNVREGLSHLLEAGVVDVVEISDDRHYSIRPTDWSSLFGLPAAPDLPFYFDWIATYRSLVAIVRWLKQPGLDDRSDYLLASDARTLVEARSTDLRQAGAPLDLYPALGPAFWDEFAEISRTVLRNAHGVN